jgi:hypothetical protein
MNDETPLLEFLQKTIEDDIQSQLQQAFKTPF